MKKQVLIMAMMLIAAISFAQTNTIVGDWLLEKIDKEGKLSEINQIVRFDKNGTLYMQEIPFGTWKYKEDSQLLFLEMHHIKGNHQIIINKDDKLVIKLNNEITYFTKIDKDIIYKNNKNSGLIGVWEINNKAKTNKKIFISFKAPDDFTLFEKDSGMESTSKGKWIVDTKDKTLNLIGRVENIKGLNTLLKVTKNEITLKNSDRTYHFNKVIQNAKKVERLGFSEKDFFNENGNYLYENETKKLPWQDFNRRITTLSKIKQLVYNYSTLIENIKSFETKKLIANVFVDEEEQKIIIDNIFYGFDRYNLPEDTAMPTESYTNYSSPLYPLKGDTFRVVGEEEIRVPAGIFTCTIIEVLIDSDSRQKLWLINNKPGVIAKIINDNSGSFGYYNTFELKEIK